MRTLRTLRTLRRWAHRHEKVLYGGGERRSPTSTLLVAVLAVGLGYVTVTGTADVWRDERAARAGVDTVATVAQVSHTKVGTELTVRFTVDGTEVRTAVTRRNYLRPSWVPGDRVRIGYDRGDPRRAWLRERAAWWPLVATTPTWLLTLLVFALLATSSAAALAVRGEVAVRRVRARRQDAAAP